MHNKIYESEHLSLFEHDGTILVAQQELQEIPFLSWLEVPDRWKSLPDEEAKALEKYVLENKSTLFPAEPLTAKQCAGIIKRGKDFVRNFRLKLTAEQVKELLSLEFTHFAGVNLSKLDLQGLNFMHGDFSGADLSNTSLDNAILTFAKLLGANLKGACLNGAHIYCANFSGADLSGADLSGANLADVVLSEDTDLSDVNISGTNFCYVSRDNLKIIYSSFSKKYPSVSLDLFTQFTRLTDSNWLATLRKLLQIFTPPQRSLFSVQAPPSEIVRKFLSVLESNDSTDDASKSFVSASEALDALIEAARNSSESFSPTEPLIQLLCFFDFWAHCGKKADIDALSAISRPEEACSAGPT